MTNSMSQQRYQLFLNKCGNPRVKLLRQLSECRYLDRQSVSSWIVHLKSNQACITKHHSSTNFEQRRNFAPAKASTEIPRSEKGTNFDGSNSRIWLFPKKFQFGWLDPSVRIRNPSFGFFPEQGCQLASWEASFHKSGYFWNRLAAKIFDWLQAKKLAPDWLLFICSGLQNFWLATGPKTGYKLATFHQNPGNFQEISRFLGEVRVLKMLKIFRPCGA